MNGLWKTIGLFPKKHGGKWWKKPWNSRSENRIYLSDLKWIHNGTSRFSTSTSVYGKVPTVPQSKFTDFLACELTP